MAKSVPFEKVIWMFMAFFNFLAFVTFFEYNNYIEPMIWVDMWLIAIFKAEQVGKAYIQVKAISAKRK